jgi:hypothetical protein
MPVVPTPSRIRFQPIDAREVATRLVEMALSQPSGPVTGFAGPRTYELKDLLHSYLDATHRHRLVMLVKIPGKAAQAVRDGTSPRNTQSDGEPGRSSWPSERVSASTLHDRAERRSGALQSRPFCAGDGDGPRLRSVALGRT